MCCIYIKYYTNTLNINGKWFSKVIVYIDFEIANLVINFLRRFFGLWDSCLKAHNFRWTAAPEMKIGSFERATQDLSNYV